MKRFAIWYIPYWGRFTRYCSYINAQNSDMAAMKLMLTNENCQEILNIEEVF